MKRLTRRTETGRGVNRAELTASEGPDSVRAVSHQPTRMVKRGGRPVLGAQVPGNGPAGPPVPFEKYEALVQELLKLKREGFVSPDEYPQVVPETDPLPPSVRRAVTDLAVTPETERHLVREAVKMLQGGMTEEEVVARVSQGEEAEL